MDLQEHSTRRLKLVTIVLLIISIVVFGVGVWTIQYSFCKAGVSPVLALMGLGTMLITIGLGLAYSLIMKSIKHWLITAGLAFSFIIMVFYFYIVSFVRCSGV